jgi:hypothetical protein
MTETTILSGITVMIFEAARSPVGTLVVFMIAIYIMWKHI